jgi:hypothetical protein
MVVTDVAFDYPLDECQHLISFFFGQRTRALLCMKFSGYDDNRLPLVSIEVEFAVPV